MQRDENAQPDVPRQTDPSALRAGDADRRRVADELQRHYVEGRLSSDELTERVRQAMAARTLGDLDAVVRDLPRMSTPGAQRADAAPPRAVPERPGPWGRRDVRAHATSYLLVMLLLVAIWLLTTPGGYFWPIWPMLGWGVAVAAHALARRGQ
jgi:hypothetical protein